MSELTEASQDAFSSQTLYESDYTRRIDLAVQRQDTEGMTDIVNTMTNNPETVEYLDFVALGRATLSLPNCFALQFMVSPNLSSINTVQHMTFVIGEIATTIDARDHNKLEDWREQRLQNTFQERLLTAVLCAQCHPDSNVKEIAERCVKYLVEMGAKMYGFPPPSPTPSPTQTLPPLRPV